MSDWLTARQLQHLQRGWRKRVETPIPTQVVSSGECFPPRQSRRQAQAEALMREKTDFYAGRQGMPRQRYLRSPSGMAAAFMAMNQVYGNVYRVDPAEAEDPAAAEDRRSQTRDQFIFDVHTHHVREDYTWEGQLWLRDVARGNNQARTPWNPALVEQELDLKYYKFDYYVKDMFFDSDTTLALLSTLALGRSRKDAAVRPADGRYAGPSQRDRRHAADVCPRSYLAERTGVLGADGPGGNRIEGGLLEGLHHRRCAGLPSHL